MGFLSRLFGGKALEVWPPPGSGAITTWPSGESFDPTWISLMVLTGLGRDERSYARKDCPYCGAVQDPLPKMKRKCPSCGQPVFVRTGADGLRHLLREADVEAHVGYFPVLEVAGESHYQRTLERIAGGRTPHGPRNTEHIAALIPDPANAHDTNAVRVVVMPVRSAANPTLQRGQAWGLVGYLTRKDAVAYRPVIDAAAAVGAVIGCMAELTGGWDRGTGDRGFFGVILHLGLPRDCEAEAARRSRPFP